MEIRFMAIGNEKRTEEREMGEEEQISLSLPSRDRLKTFPRLRDSPLSVGASHAT